MILRGCPLVYFFFLGCGFAAGAHPDHYRKVTNEGPATLYSSFRCSGVEKVVEEHQGRVCIFHAVCATGGAMHNAQAPDITFYKKNLTHPLLFDELHGYLSSFNVTDTFVDLTPRPREDVEHAPPVRFLPRVVQESLPAKAVHSMGVHVLWEMRLGDDNVGHLVWEDLYHIWLSLRVFQTPTRNVQVLNVGMLCSHLCAKLAAAFITALMHKPVQPYVGWAEEVRKEAGQAGNAPICFETLVVGGYAAYLGHGSPLPHGSEPMLYEYRSETLRAHGLDPDKTPNEHHILLVKKATSSRGSMRNIVNLQEVETFLKETYPGIRVSVVEWHHMSMQHQFETLMSTTIVITPSGGGSMLLPFLPLGAHAIIMDYWQHEWDGLNRSASLEGNFWDRWPHIKNDYYLVNSPEQHVMNDDCANRPENERCHPRDGASVIVDEWQLKVLIDGALAEMEGSVGPGQGFEFKKRRVKA